MRQILILCFLLVATLPALAQSPETVAQRADPAVGRVINLGRHGELSTGSGFIIAAVSGGGQFLFLTNHHVAEGGGKLVIGFLQDGKVYFYEARVVADDRAHDLAALAFEAPRPGTAQAGHHPVVLPIRVPGARKAEAVAALGFPGVSDNLGTTPRDPDFYNSTITLGNASKILNQTWDGKGGRPFEIVQHTASINPGNSGGPLLDLCAQVVGLNTMVALDGVSGGNANDTYFASGSRTITDFLAAHDLPFTRGEQSCSGGEVAAGPVPGSAPPPDLPPGPVESPLGHMPVWLIAAICFALVMAVIGGIVAVGRRRSGAGAMVSAVPPRGTVLTLRSGTGQWHVSAAELARGLRIGRAPEAEIRIDAAGISRFHATLRLEGRRLLLTDLGSTNGTRVDGRPLAPNVPAQIVSRSRIELGSGWVQIMPPGGRK